MSYAVLIELFWSMLAMPVSATGSNIPFDLEAASIANNLGELSQQFHTQHACANAILTAFYVTIGELDDSADDRTTAIQLMSAYGMLFQEDQFRMINDIYRDRPNDEEFAPYFEHFNVTEAECDQETDYDGVLKEGFIKSGLGSYMKKAYAQQVGYILNGESPDKDKWSRVDDDPNDGAETFVNWSKWVDSFSSWKKMCTSIVTGFTEWFA